MPVKQTHLETLRKLWNAVAGATQSHGVVLYIPGAACWQSWSLLTYAITLQAKEAILKLLLLPRLVRQCLRRKRTAEALLARINMSRVKMFGTIANLGVPL